MATELNNFKAELLPIKTIVKQSIENGQILNQLVNDVIGVKADVTYTRTSVGDFWTQRLSILAPIGILGVIGLVFLKYYSYENSKPRFLKKMDCK